MAKKWQTKLSKDFTLTTIKYPFKEPFLSKPANNDLTKQWVVEYGAWSEREGKIIRERVTLKGKTVADRMADVRFSRKAYHSKIEDRTFICWFFLPLSNFIRRLSAQRAMGAKAIILLPPMFNLVSGIFQRQEPVGVQTFISKTAIKRLNKRVISGRRTVGLLGREKSSITPLSYARTGGPA